MSREIGIADRLAASPVDERDPQDPLADWLWECPAYKALTADDLDAILAIVKNAEARK